ncbi:MAG: hypothetical protein EAZ85_06990 [Bacteroidetes bacterium]|nr:MAG: hypothetical protein EAZ85_06990 [Bacteroidota bacterium]TAG87802.1 MAG: hypothetical protein EAZ20_09850 [Bacteroidota bacterium]
MKKIFFLSLIILGIITFSCKKNSDEGVQPNNKLSLTSQKGIKIANSIGELTNKITKSTKQSNIDIKKISYIEVKEEIAVIIEYTSNNITETIILHNYLKKDKSGSVDFLESAWVVNCTGACGCRERVIIRKDDTLSFECTCDDCLMSVVKS